MQEKYLIKLGLGVMFISYGILLFMITKAFVCGEFRILVDFNFHGEGKIELILMMLAFIPVVYTVWALW